VKGKDNSNASAGTYTLWGGPLSLYSGKARSYLIKKGIPYREYFGSHPDFARRIVPAVGLVVIPVLEAPDGTIVQDTTCIIEYLEAVFPEPCFVPSTPLQNAVAWLIGAFGSEGLLQTAMHYRWSYRREQEPFLRAEFGRAICAGPARAANDAAAVAMMQAMNGYLQFLGVSGATAPAIEASYEALLEILERHFLHHPYVLGGRPSIADFGLMAPLYAHLSRDPYPSNLMKLKAPNVYRWTERMNLAQVGDGEFVDYAEVYPPGDQVPETLLPLLQHIFADWGPELIAYASRYNEWVKSNPSLPAAHLASLSGDRRVHPSLGEVSYRLRGTTIRRQCAAQALWHFEKAAALARGFTGNTRRRFEEMLRQTGGEDVMGLSLARPLRREDNLLVVG
jgi:glutathione S-transferase